VQAVLDEEIQRLPACFREAFVLCVLEGKSGPEAAAELCCKEGTVKSRVNRARRALKRQLARRDINLALLLAAVSVAESTARAALPAALVQTTIRFGLLVAAGESAAGVIPNHIAALAAGVTRAMSVTKTKAAIAILLTLTIASAAGGLAYTSAPFDEAKAAPRATAKEQAGKVPQPAADDMIAFRGRVLDPDGKPFAGAKVALIADEKGAFVPQLTSDHEGKFTLRVPRPRTGIKPRQVVVAASGFGIDWESEHQTDATFHLVPDLPIVGRVVNLEGKPVAGATVAVHDVLTGPPGAFEGLLKNWKKTAQEQEEAARKLDRQVWYSGRGLGKVFRTTTDRDGKFTLAGFGKDRVVTLLISGPGVADTFAAVATREGFDPSGAPLTPLRLYAPRFELVVYPEKPVTGVVYDEQTKTPLPGVRVSGTALTGPLPEGMYLFHTPPMPATVTDQEGRFTLHGLAKAKAYILVADPDEGTEHLHRFASVADTDGFVPAKADIDLPRGIVLTGRVTNTVSGKPAPARVFYRPLQSNDELGKFPAYSPPELPAPWHRGRDTKTDLDGNYRITVMPGPGVVHVQAYGAFEPAQAARKDIDDGIIDKQFGHFRTVGQGGMYNPEYMNAYRVIRPPASDRTATLDVTVQPVKLKPKE
jgi:protocatechuate 3,4-dioxygenase beta subunit